MTNAEFAKLLRKRASVLANRKTTNQTQTVAQRLAELELNQLADEIEEGK
jgi:hypothetical protein